jgi:hypothetical protein
MADWIEDIRSAWKGHRAFAEWLVREVAPSCIVDLGVDYGYSTFVFASTLKAVCAEKGTVGTTYGIDLFKGDPHTGTRETYDSVAPLITEHGLDCLEIIKKDFKEASLSWTKPIQILHIDGYHTSEEVTSDFSSWAPFVAEDGVILLSNTAVGRFGVRSFFSGLTDGNKLYFTNSYGLGIYTKNAELAQKIKDNFADVNDFAVKPF